MLALHLLQDFRRRGGQARPLDVSALMALLYWPSCTTHLALLKLLAEVEDDEHDCLLARDRASSRALHHREDKSLSAQRWR